MATPSRTKKVVLTALVGLGATAGAAGIAAAATSQPAPADRTTSRQQTADAENGENDQSPDYTSSVTVPQTLDSGTESDDEAGEAAKLAPLATVTPEQAAAAD